MINDVPSKPAMQEETFEFTVQDRTILERSLIDQVEELLEALCGIMDIGKRDMTNPKYDPYFKIAREILKKHNRG